MRALGEWIDHRLTFVAGHGAVPAGPSGPVVWPMLPGGELPERRGPRPTVSWTIPQQQESDNAPIELQERLFAEVATLAGVEVEASRISVPGARAFTLHEGSTDPDAYLVAEVGEFAHLHPSSDGSLHLVLPPDQAADVSTKGWGRPHMWAGTRLSPGFVMVYGPRDEDELATVLAIVTASHAHATAAAS